MTIDELVIKVIFNTDDLDSGLKSAKGKISNFANGIKEKLGSDKIKNFFANVIGIAEIAKYSLAGIVASIASAWVAAFSRAMRQMKAEGEALKEVSEKTGANVEDLSAWSNMVEEAGGSAKSFQNAIVFLSKDLTRLSLTGRSMKKPFYQALGLDVQKLSGKPVLDVIKEISHAVDGMDKKKSHDILMGLGFDNDTIQLIQSGGKNIDALIDKQKEWGVYTLKDIEALDKLNKTVKTTTAALKTTFLPLFSLIIQELARITEHFNKFVLYLRNNTKVIKGLIILLAGLFAKDLANAVLDMYVAISTSPLAMFIATLGALLLVLEDLWTYAQGGESAFAGLWEKIGTPDEVMEKFEKVGTAIEGFFETFADFFDEFATEENVMLAFFMVLVAAIVSLVSLIGGIPLAIAAVIAFILAYGKTVKEAFLAVGRIILSLFTEVLPKGLQAIWDAADQAVTEAIDYITQKFIDVADFLSSVWEGIVSTCEEKFTEAVNFLGSIWDSLVASFDEGCASISSFLTNAANSAKAAWAGFISWLEEKWIWLKGLLPSFEGIASKLPSFGNSPKLAVEGAGGGGTTNYVDDHKVVTVNTHTGESTERAMKELNLTSQVESGWHK